MSKHSRFAVLSGVLLFVLLASLACPTAVFADDGTPPPAATEEPVNPPTGGADQPPAAEAGDTQPPPATEESAVPATSAVEDPVTVEATPSPAVEPTEEATDVPEEVPSPAEAVATDVPAEEATSVPSTSEATESPEEPAASEDLTVAEVLEAAPEGTEVVVLDENGEALPLVSTEAAEIVATADPMWCPVIAGVPTLPGGAGCSPNFGTPQALIDNMDVTDPQTPGFGLYEQPGIIYFTADLTDPGNSFILIRGGLDDNVASPELYDADYDALKGYDLILQGGWSGVNGDTNFTQTDFGANPVQIGTSANPWIGSVTINDITINGVTTGTGLTVYTQGNINLDNVTANDNAGDGAELDNCIDAGAGCTGNGDVSVIDSNFDGNNKGPLSAGSGLYIDSGGHVSLDRVSASNNGRTPGSAGGNGAQIYNFSSLTIRDSVFNNNYSPVDDFGWGLWVDDGYGAVTLTNVTASGNDNGNPDEEWTAGGAHIFTDGNINIDLSEFNDNADGPGLDLLVSGDVTLADVTANGNGLGGANIVNLFGSGNISISYSNFDGNAGPFGLEILVFVPLAGGTVKLDHVSASNNASGDGFILFGPPFGSIVSVVVQDSTFDANGLNGAFLATSGDATLICSQFKDNGTGGSAGEGFGVDGSFVDGTFTLNDVTFSGNADGDYVYTGMPVITSGGCKVVVKGAATEAKPKPGHSLPLHIVPVNGGEQIELNCSAYSGTKLILPNGDQVTLPCPIHDHGVLTGKTADQLPAPLNAPFGFASALEIQVIRGGKTVDKVNQGMTIDFVIPADQQGANFAILRWDAEKSQWVEVPGGTKTGDGRFMATSTFTGIYVLVTK